jgi:hypothetical protein
MPMNGPGGIIQPRKGLGHTNMKILGVTFLALSFLLLAGTAQAQDVDTQATLLLSGGSCRGQLVCSTVYANDLTNQLGQQVLSFTVSVSAAGNFVNGTIFLQESDSYAVTFASTNFTGTYQAPANPNKSQTYITTLTGSFSGADSNGDTFNGTITQHFQLYYVNSCQGRGCASAGWHLRPYVDSTHVNVVTIIY